MGWFARAARLKTLPVALWPVTFGLAYGFDHGGSWSGVRAAAALAAVALLHMGASLAVDLADHRSGAGKIARMERASVPTGTNAIAEKVVAEHQVRGLVTIILASSAILWALTGDGFLLGALAVALAAPFAALPAGVTELAQAVGRAGLPFAAAAAALDGGSPAKLVAVAAIPTAFVFAAIVAESLLQWRADRAVNRRTLAARAEFDRSLFITGGVLSLTFAAIIVEVAFDVLPTAALFSLFAAVPVAGALARAARDPAPQHMLRLLGATLGASLLTGIVLTLAGVLS